MALLHNACVRFFVSRCDWELLFDKNIEILKLTLKPLRVKICQQDFVKNPVDNFLLEQKKGFIGCLDLRLSLTGPVRLTDGLAQALQGWSDTMLLSYVTGPRSTTEKRIAANEIGVGNPLNTHKRMGRALP